MLGPVYSRGSLLALLTAAIAATELFDGAKIHLVENTDPITPDTPVGDLVEATYEGYAASSAVVFLTPHTDINGVAVVQVTPKEFKPTGDATVSTVTQVVLMNGAGSAIHASYMLDDPIIFGDEDDVHLIGFPLMLVQPAVDLENIVP